MEIDIVKPAGDETAENGWVTFEVKLGLEEVVQLREDALRALGIERSLPAEARTKLAGADDATYITDFIENRVASDTLEAHGLVPAAEPKVRSNAGAVDAGPFTCYVHAHPRPAIGLTSLAPVDLAVNRIPKPGFSLQAAREGSDDVEYLDDVKTLRLAMTERLDSDFPESAMHAISEEYQNVFERELDIHGYDPETYRAVNQLDDEQYAIMLTRRALSDARWNYALDAVFSATDLTIDEDDLLEYFEVRHPGYSRELFELHDLRGDLHRTVEAVRHEKALGWLLDNAIR